MPEFLAARLHNVFGQNLDMSALVQRSQAAILDTVEVQHCQKALPSQS